MSEYRLVRDKLIKRVVLKVGSNLLIKDNGVNTEFIDHLSNTIKNLRDARIECIIVSSGAVGCGLEFVTKRNGRSIKQKTNKLSIPEKQAAAAIGQSKLIQYYSQSLMHYGIIAAQLLVTYDDIHNRLRYLNINNTVSTLLKQGVVPIFNENDTVAVDEITFGDNDYLSALITHLVGADLLVLLSTVEGLLDESKNIVRNVYKINQDVKDMIQDTRSQYGTGGMISKINAAEKLMQTGHMLAILNGSDYLNIHKLFNNQVVGTVFYPNIKNYKQKKLWIGFASKSKGKLVIDAGAAKAIIDKNTSLLPVGVVKAEGVFGRGDIVDIIHDNQTIAKGQTNYSFNEVEKIKLLQSSEIIKVLDYKPYDEVVHKNNMIIINKE